MGSVKKFRPIGQLVPSTYCQIESIQKIHVCVFHVTFRTITVKQWKDSIEYFDLIQDGI